MTSTADIHRFVTRIITLVRPWVEAKFGALPPFALVPHAPQRPLGDPSSNNKFFATGHDTERRTLAIFYEPPTVQRFCEQQPHLLANVLIHELLHLYQLWPLYRHLGWTWDSIIAYRNGRYNPADPANNYEYWMEGAVTLAEVLVVIETADDRRMSDAMATLLGPEKAFDAVFGDNCIADRAINKLASIIILASRDAGRQQPDLGLVHLPCALPDWLGHLANLPPYEGQFRSNELPYYLGAYYCGRLLATHPKLTLSRLLRTPIPDDQFKSVSIGHR